MEPGLRDREYAVITPMMAQLQKLQWSPVLETGNTARWLAAEAAADQGCNGARS